MEAQKKQYTIDALASLVYKVESCWAKKKLVATLFMNFKELFNHVLKIRLAKEIIKLGINGDLI